MVDRQQRVVIQDLDGNILSDEVEVIDVPEQVVNAEQIFQRVDQLIPTLQQWVQNNPNGAVLNAAQTRLLIRLVIGLAKIARVQFDDTAGT